MPATSKATPLNPAVASTEGLELFIEKVLPRFR